MELIEPVLEMLRDPEVRAARVAESNARAPALVALARLDAEREKIEGDENSDEVAELDLRIFTLESQLALATE